MRYRKTVVWVLAVLVSALLAALLIYRSDNGFAEPHERHTDREFLSQMEELYATTFLKRVGFAYYEVVEQDNGFTVAVAVTPRTKGHIMKFGVPVSVTGDEKVEFVENMMSICVCISRFADCCYPEYWGGYSWENTECDFSLQTQAACERMIMALREPDAAEEECHGDTASSNATTTDLE